MWQQDICVLDRERASPSGSSTSSKDYNAFLLSKLGASIGSDASACSSLDLSTLDIALSPWHITTAFGDVSDAYSSSDDEADLELAKLESTKQPLLADIQELPAPEITRIHYSSILDELSQLLKKEAADTTGYTTDRTGSSSTDYGTDHSSSSSHGAEKPEHSAATVATDSTSAADAATAGSAVTPTKHSNSVIVRSLGFGAKHLPDFTEVCSAAALTPHSLSQVYSGILFAGLYTAATSSLETRCTYMLECCVRADVKQSSLISAAAKAAAQSGLELLCR
jgi:hypothetical protein